MNKLLIFFIILFPVLIISGCKKDPLDITPDGRITMQDVFKDNILTEAYVSSIYNYIPLYGSRYYPNVMLAVFSDEAHGSDDPQDGWSNVSQWYGGMLKPSYNPLDAGTNRESGIKWNGQYYEDAWGAIRKANTFLTEIPNVQMADQHAQARFTAEVKLLRAFFYLGLIKMYGGMPVIDKQFADNFDYTTLHRNSFEECVSFIVNDCNAAINEPNLPYRISIEGERGRFTKAVAYAIKSQALLYNASPLWNPGNDLSKWQLAAAAGKEAVNALTQNGYDLYTDYESYFQGNSSNTNDRETIFEIKNADATYGGILFFINGIPTVGAALAGATPSQELVDSYDMANGKIAISGYRDAEHLQPVINTASGYDEAQPYKDRDPRFYASVWYNQSYYGVINGTPHYVASYLGGEDGLAQLRQRTHNGYYLRKFNDPDLRIGNVGNVRWKKYRLAEIYLNYAEAENEAAGATPEAYEAINTIRERAKMPVLPDGLTKEEMRERIHRERRVEMAFEEQRFWDVRRWKILDQTDKLTTGIAWKKEADNSFTKQRIVVDRRSCWADQFRIFPIPLNELSTLPAFTQNPGW
ncbi:RagB/SusD family nutrient uptake outer membrane protein [Chitinophaga sp. MM2321]|uniref:RagB/SusD family nutrient uptake outer membrane protein n=1 Tax=Chitinophaga sp. MM2321 TaxID=3137178 RepID=UPI0032D59EE2